MLWAYIARLWTVVYLPEYHTTKLNVGPLLPNISPIEYTIHDEKTRPVANTTPHMRHIKPAKCSQHEQ